MVKQIVGFVLHYYCIVLGVKFSVRKLNVGDFLWVAREKVNIVHGMTICVCDVYQYCVYRSTESS